MTFDDILAQVQALLQREQRLSYRALQRRFALEEADLEALKDEFTYAKRLAVAPVHELELWRGLGQLVQAEMLYQRSVLPQGTYLFEHALIQEAAYQSLLRSTRQ